jgi:hypothetical protein
VVSGIRIYCYVIEIYCGQNTNETIDLFHHFTNRHDLRKIIQPLKSFQISGIRLFCLFFFQFGEGIKSGEFIGLYQISGTYVTYFELSSHKLFGHGLSLSDLYFT